MRRKDKVPGKDLIAKAHHLGTEAKRPNGVQLKLKPGHSSIVGLLELKQRTSELTLKISLIKPSTTERNASRSRTLRAISELKPMISQS